MEGTTDQRSEEETIRCRYAVIRRALNTPLEQYKSLSRPRTVKPDNKAIYRAFF